MKRHLHQFVPGAGRPSDNFGVQDGGPLRVGDGIVEPGECVGVGDHLGEEGPPSPGVAGEGHEPVPDRVVVLRLPVGIGPKCGGEHSPAVGPD